MTGFKNMGELVDAEINGQVKYTSWRKAPIQATTIGIWFDLSMSPGMPAPQYYAAAPLEATSLARSSDGGLDHGGTTGSTKVLRRTMAAYIGNGNPMPMMMLDYLLFYPFIDQGTTDVQIMTNDTLLPRHTTGLGVQMMAISVAAPTGGQTFQVTYTNSDGVSGRLSDICRINAAPYVGAIASSDRVQAAARGPFIPLASGDVGVRSIESFQMISGTDTGLISMVLVYPTAQFQIRGGDAPVEVDYFQDFSQIPVIEDDAYLNWICCPAGSLSGGNIIGDMTTVWS